RSHAERIRQGQMYDLDLLVGLGLCLPQGQPGCGVKVDDLIEDARRGMDHAERDEYLGANAGLLAQLTPGAVQRRFSRAEPSGRDLQQMCVNRGTELAD